MDGHTDTHGLTIHYLWIGIGITVIHLDSEVYVFRTLTLASSIMLKGKRKQPTLINVTTSISQYL